MKTRKTEVGDKEERNGQIDKTKEDPRTDKRPGTTAGDMMIDPTIKDSLRAIKEEVIRESIIEMMMAG